MNKTPWLLPDEWEEVELFFKTTLSHNSSRINVLHGFAASIYHLYEEVSEPINEICSLTCAGCDDICCGKATIWYDFRDLLYHYLIFNQIPKKQISKFYHNSQTICRNLDDGGCILPRTKRPFVCTWYFCPRQKYLISSEYTHYSGNILKNVDRIKQMRIKMEEEFYRITAY